MKKVIIILIIFLVTGCSNPNLKEEKENIIKPKITYETNSDTINFKVSSEFKDLIYELKKANEIIKEGKVEEKNKIENLDSDQKYLLKVYNNKTKIEQEITTDKEVIIRFGGDVMMTSYFKNYIDKYGVDYPWSDTNKLIKEATYSIFNLETSVSNKGSSTKPEGYGFESDPSTLKGLVNASIDMVNLANNHVLDYGNEAFIDTLDHLKQNNIEYIGAGRNKEEASKINYQNIEGINIAFIGATSILGHSNWKATDNNGGVFYLNPHNYEDLKQKIKEAKTKAKYVILFVHWDLEYYDYPEEKTIEIAHDLIDNGVDIIIGSHPHVLQGVEFYNSGIIFYSTGNYNFLVKNENATRTGLFEIILDKDKIKSSKIYPIKINNCKANLLEENTKEFNTIINSLKERSNKFNTIIDNLGNIKRQVT